ncbi:hypothetical protein [Shimia sp.]|uniref:hypothetical protein n=1 Tax=Shimia sp. TaxID=1954381 RepID=UPI003BA871C5
MPQSFQQTHQISGGRIFQAQIDNIQIVTVDHANAVFHVNRGQIARLVPGRVYEACAGEPAKLVAARHPCAEVEMRVFDAASQTGVFTSRKKTY